MHPITLLKLRESVNVIGFDKELVGEASTTLNTKRDTSEKCTIAR